MGDSEQMPNVDLNKEKLSKTHLRYMEIVEKQNLERVKKLQQIRRRNIITGCAFGAGVIGIYLYSMFAIKQEKFLDDFEEPKKTEKIYT